MYVSQYKVPLLYSGYHILILMGSSYVFHRVPCIYVGDSSDTSHSVYSMVSFMTVLVVYPEAII